MLRAPGGAGAIPQAWGRGDVGTVKWHVAALDDFDPAMGRLYRELAARNIPLGLARGSLKPEAAALIRDALERS